MSPTPTISVIIPCYNQEQFIQKTVQAILDQSDPADEIIIVDDGSQDSSIPLLKTLPNNAFDRLRMIQHPQNRGLAEARNTGWQAANSEVVLYIDSDAYADKNLVKVLRQAYQSQAAPGLPPLAGIGGRGIEQNIQSIYDRWRALYATQSFGLQPHPKVRYLFGLCMSYKRHLLQETGGFDPAFRNAAEDVFIGHRLRRMGYRLQYIPEAIVYHQHTDDEAKLKRVQYGWYYWGCQALKRTSYPLWPVVIGSLRSLMISPISDLLLRQDFLLARLDVEMSLIKLKAVQDVARSKPFSPPEKKPTA